MKKILLLFGIMLVAGTAMAQTKFGVKAGFNASNLSAEKMVSWQGSEQTSFGSFMAGAHIGGYMNYSYDKRLGLQAELLFSMQGGGEDHDNNTVRQNYINIPVLIDFKLFNSPLHFLVGPQLGYCVYRSVNGEKVEVNGDVGTGFNNLDVAIVLGVQYALTAHLMLDFRTNIGVRPSVDYVTPPPPNAAGDFVVSKVGARNNVLQLGVGWTF